MITSEITKEFSEGEGEGEEHFQPGSIHAEAVRSFWLTTLKCSPWVEEILRRGYKIPFKSLPGKYEEPNNASVMKNPQIVAEIVLELKKQRIISFTDSKPFCVNPLGLVTRVIDGVVKHRLVFDASRWINLHTDPPAVKLVHLTRAIQMTEKGEFQSIFDLRSAYYHVKIAEEHIQYLGASVVIDGKQQYFVFKHLPFGLNSAVHAITKLWKPLVAYFHSEGIKFSIYIDDGRILAENQQDIEKKRQKVFEVVQKAGWQIAWDKSDGPLEGAQTKKYLGFLLNSDSMTVKYPQEKLSEVLNRIENHIKNYSIPVKQLASLLGKIISLSPSHGAIVRICTRSGYIMLETHVNQFGWVGQIVWSPETRKEFEFFLMNANKFNGAKMSNDLTDVSLLLENPRLKAISRVPKTISQIAVSDASNTKAVVKWLQGPLQGQTSHFQFDLKESNSSSGERELLAILRFFQDTEASRNLKGSNVMWLTDSENVVSFITKGSPKAHIQEKVFEILSITSALDCVVSPVHLFREDERIKEADLLSKSKNSDNWSIDYLSFKKFDEDFNFELDLFADQNNARTKNFVSEFYHPNAIAVDAFTIPWLGMCWICPPTSLICRVVRRIKTSKCQGLLIIPDWPASDFYCEIFEKAELKPPFKFLQVFKPYIFQNEEARNTPLFGKTAFKFFAIYFDTL